MSFEPCFPSATRFGRYDKQAIPVPTQPMVREEGVQLSRLTRKRRRSTIRRVEDWRGTSKGPFPAPASSNPACRFPAQSFPGRFASWVMRPITWEHFRATRYSASSSRPSAFTTT